jgi:uncharacterized protein
MSSPVNTAEVAEHVLLDSRLAIFHQRQRWLAVADLHFGYEISQRAAGRLMPMWGMETIEARLLQLVRDYEPEHLVIVGDVVHDRAAAAEAAALVARLASHTTPIVLAGNHDRKLGGVLPLRDAWETDGFYFHHGHCEADAGGRIQIIGHHHPCATIRDGAGLRLKLPALVQQDSCWILPAFSPWAAGAPWKANEQSQLWLCSPHRILKLSAEAAATC